MSLICANKSVKPQRILEIGCGTGHLTKLVLEAFPQAELIACDFSKPMVAHCVHQFDQASFLVMDGEQACFQPKSFDLIVSSMTIQWFEKPSDGLVNLHNLLKPEGHLFYAAPTDKSFPRWQKILEEQGHAHGLNLPSDLPNIIDAQWYELPTENGLSFLRSLKNIGAATPRYHYIPLTAGSMRRALRQFDNHIDTNVRWHIAFGQNSSP